jgi:predicted AAA+ superfamily ATPase
MQLMPLAVSEAPKVGMLNGGYPEVVARPKAARLWFSSYLQTYIERDVRSVSAIQDLGAFRRFLSLLATRHGQILNKTDLSAPLSMSVPGIGKWLDILEMTAQIIVVPPFFASASSARRKSSSLILDSPVTCSALRRKPNWSARRFLAASLKDWWRLKSSRRR